MRMLILILACVTGALSQESGCGDDKVQFGFEGTFTSMNFSAGVNRYEPNAFCEWILETSITLGQAIQLEFDYFSVENAVNCIYDSVKAYDGITNSDPVLRNMCGHNVPAPTVSSGTLMLVEFETDGSVQYYGFSAFWTARDQPVECDSTISYRCGDDVNGYCIPIEQRCDGKQDCSFGEDELGCAGNSATCGRPAIEPVLTSDVGTNIIGGSEAVPGSWPWTARIERSLSHTCGATIINNKWVLTAASCVFTYQNNPQVFDVITGDHDFSTKTDPYEKFHTIADIFIHDDYSPQKQEWNFALLQIRGNIAMNNDHVLEICLPNDHDIFPGGTETWVAGWGDTQPEVVNTVLNQANVTLYSNEYCNDPSRHAGEVTESLLCGGDTTTDACIGDEGGPMVGYRPPGASPDDDRWYLIGVVGQRGTGGVGCVVPDKPGLYGNVASVVNWITATINAN